MKSMSVDICVSRVISDDRNVGQPLAWFSIATTGNPSNKDGSTNKSKAL